MERSTVLLAYVDASWARDVQVGLEARGFAVEEASGQAPVLASVERAALTIVGLDAAGADLGQRLELLQRVVRAARNRPVVVLAPEEIPCEVLLEAGATDILEPATPPVLVAQRVSTLLRQDGKRGRHTEPDDFMARLAERLVRAREREVQAPIFVVRAPGQTSRLAEELAGAIEEAAQVVDHDSEVAFGASRVATLPVGEDGLALLVPDLHRVQDAARFATALRSVLARRCTVPVLIGIACSPTDGTDADSLVKRAHEASQRALRDGQGEVVFNSDAMGRWAFERLTLEASLRNALQNGELVLYYQPRIDIESREIRGMEALLRWNHPQFGLVSPGQFIPLAEETGLIVPIGEWIVGEAARQNRRWREAGLPRIRVSVNLSPVQFRRDDLFERVSEAVTASGLEPDGLELEVTESLLMNDPAQTAATLGRFKAFGLKLSIDDFGTGYSSLSYLKRFPIDALKIDRSFVTDVTTNPDDAAIATAIILMGHSLKLKVVAEGVETENQLAFLRVLQCNEAQGFLFSPPVPAAKATALLASGAAAFRAAA